MNSRTFKVLSGTLLIRSQANLVPSRDVKPAAASAVRDCQNKDDSSQVQLCLPQKALNRLRLHNRDQQIGIVLATQNIYCANMFST
jgi:hypothetical protein